MFGPLHFDYTDKLEAEYDQTTPCLLCDDTFNIQICFDVFLKHLFEVHKLVIEDVQNIQLLTEYMRFWKNKLTARSLEEIVPRVTVDSTSGYYYFLSPMLKDDKFIRHKLKLDHVLKVQEFERTNDGYKKDCLFCRTQFEGTRLNFVQHLNDQHNLILGNPQNLVYVEEFIFKLEEKLNNLQCLYCEKTFPDRTILKEHMRKKMHKRIKPHNKIYDKYYIVNYLEVDRSWQDINKEDDKVAIDVREQENSDLEYSDWEEHKSVIITCLFCQQKECNITTLIEHLATEHKFNYLQITNEFDFYLKVKVVNYIRKEVYSNSCIFCNSNFVSNDGLLSHMTKEDHYKLPEKKLYDQPEYFFSTYENDSFLYLIFEDD